MHSDIDINYRIENFKSMLNSGKDSAVLRFSLGSMLLEKHHFDEAIAHLEVAIEQNPNYSAAHKLLARALAESNQHERAIAAYEAGIKTAQQAGDKQAEKEMQVFLRRLRKN